MNTDNVVEFLRQLSLDVSLGAAAQQAASQRDAPLALARLATAHGLPCSAADWSAFTRGCLDESNASLTDIEAADAVIWQLVQDPARVPAWKPVRLPGSSASWPRTARHPWSARWSATWPARRAGEPVHPHQFLKPQSPHGAPR